MKWLVDIAYLDNGAYEWRQVEVDAEHQNSAEVMAVMELSLSVRRDITARDVEHVRARRIFPKLWVVAG